MIDCLVVDPPWEYKNKKTGGSHISGASQKYGTLSVIDIKYLNTYLIPLLKKDCSIFFWTTNPMLKDALDILMSWGFTYKGMITWDKINKGMGYWFRGQTEHLLFGIKGNVRAFRCQQSNFIRSKAGRHSEKPIESYQLIEKAMPRSTKFLELFATRQYRDWKCIGFGLTGRDIKEDLQLLNEPSRS